MKLKQTERGQSILLFAILMPVMSLFLLGILDYLVTNARVNVMSILSPALTPSMFFLFSIFRVTVRPSGVVTVIDGTAGSTAFTVTVALS